MKKPSSFNSKHRQREIERCFLEYGLSRSPRHLFRGGDQDTANASPIRRLRKVLERLGPVFSLFGLYLSSRVDLLRIQDCLELATIADLGAVTPGPVVHDIIEQALGRPPERMFMTFESVPFESRLMFQSHDARFLDGTVATLKVTHPSLNDQVERDASFLSRAQTALSAADGAEFSIDAVIEDFLRTLRRRENYQYEAEAMRMMATEANVFDRLHAPRVYPDCSTSNVLTIERPHGWPIGAVIASQQGTPRTGETGRRGSREGPDLDPGDLARLLCFVWLRQVLHGRLYPVELSPGDITVLPTRQVAFTGGVFATIPSVARENLWHYIIATASADPDRAYEYLIREMEEDQRVHRDNRLRNRFRQVVPFRDGAWSQAEDADTLAEHLFVHWRLAHEYGFRPRLHLLNFYRGMLTMTAMARRLAPERDSLREGLDDLRVTVGLAQVGTMMSPDQWWTTMQKYAIGMMELPQKLDEVFMQVTRGDLLSHRQRARPSRYRQPHTTSAGILALICLLGAVVLVSHHVRASVNGSVWIDWISALVCGLLGFLILFVLRKR